MVASTIPFKYLGVPLSLKKLTTQQCKPLVNKITSRIESWAVRFLSYAGRLKLIKSVLFGIQTYWAQIFILPKKIMKEIESRFKAFLWTGKANPTKKSLVAWKTICFLKSCGGWNVIELCDWNIAAICKVLWDITHKADSLWVKWLHVYYFKAKDFWTAAIPQKGSWVLRKLMKYRSLIKDLGGWNSVTGNNKVQIKKVYAKLRQQADKVPWKRIICNNSASLRSVFMLWLANWNRLMTKDRILTWNQACDPICFMCLQENESVQHLFFLFNYSSRIWAKVLKILNCSKPVQGFKQEADWAIKRSRRTDSISRLHFMFLAEAVHSIWLQRNNVLFNGYCDPAHTVFKQLVYRVACRCSNDDKKKLFWITNGGAL
ncbi:uncharacterized protein LOC110685546 [Chenopodium quinoa]|uniref:uncharacterized protein LOC110685546 n=1 Tax=Chenopodium quinoa TaxID=63459 RepID=UPI000B787DCE|nr:uncharacterized protein LOC110685546 [Chenopodium quinoa]